MAERPVNKSYITSFLPSPTLFVALLTIGIAFVANYTNSVPPAYDFPELNQHVSRGNFFNWEGHAIYYLNTDGKASAHGALASADLKKPLLVLLHGFPTSSYDWHPLWETLSSNFTLLAVDFLGFGLSDKPFYHVYSLMEQTDIIEALIQIKYPYVTGYHIMAHDIGATVAQELLARGIARKTSTHSSAAKPLSAVLLNGGIIQSGHKPLMSQRLLSQKFIGPIVKAVCVNVFTFRYSLNRVFGPDTKLDSLQMDIHWSLFANKGGPRIIDKLLGYMHERKSHNTRWKEALFDSTAPIAVINGPADPVSGRHMYDAVLASRSEHLTAQKGRHPSKAGSYDPASDADVKAARKADLYIVLEDHIGHYPQLEDPIAVVSAVRMFYEALRQVHY